MNRFLASLTLALVTPVVVAQGPDPDSPRIRAAREVENMFAAIGGDEALDVFLTERLGGALAEEAEELAHAILASRSTGARLVAILPDGQHGGRVRFALAAGGSASVSFELEPEPPHRFTRFELFGFDASERALDDEAMAAALRAHVEDLVERDLFSGTVLLARGDQALVRAAYGLASKRFGVPNAPDTKLNLGSANKMFTGVAICQLVEAGKLAFDDRVGKHLPDYPNRDVARKVTIHHLLTHTSGLGSYWNERWQERWTRLRTVEDLLPTFVDDPLAFEPGTDFRYSNVGPIVLGLILERVTGEDYFDYVREHVYEPAGMVDTDCYAMDRPVPNLAIGYTRQGPDGGDGEWRNNLFLHSVRGGPAGGGFSTVDDLLRFSLALQAHELLSPEMTETLITSKVGMGPDFGYGYLFGDHREGGHRSHGHNGGAPGISADFAFYPELGYTLAVLSNYDEGAARVSSFARQLIESRPAPAK